MKIRKLGTLEVSAPGLGCMGMTHSYTPFPDRNEMIKLIRTAHDMGVTFFAYMVLEQGALSGKYDTKHPFPENSDRGKHITRYLINLKY